MMRSVDSRIPLNLLDDQMLSVRQIAELDGTSEDTVRREIKKGTLKATKLSARRLGVRTSNYRAARAGDVKAAALAEAIEALHRLARMEDANPQLAAGPKHPLLAAALAGYREALAEQESRRSSAPASPPR